MRQPVPYNRTSTTVFLFRRDRSRRLLVAMAAALTLTVALLVVRSVGHRALGALDVGGRRAVAVVEATRLAVGRTLCNEARLDPVSHLCWLSEA